MGKVASLESHGGPFPISCPTQLFSLAVPELYPVIYHRTMSSDCPPLSGAWAWTRCHPMEGRWLRTGTAETASSITLMQGIPFDDSWWESCQILPPTPRRMVWFRSPGWKARGPLFLTLGGPSEDKLILGNQIVLMNDEPVSAVRGSGHRPGQKLQRIETPHCHSALPCNCPVSKSAPVWSQDSSLLLPVQCDREDE